MGLNLGGKGDRSEFLIDKSLWAYANTVYESAKGFYVENTDYLGKIRTYPSLRFFDKTVESGRYRSYNIYGLRAA